MFSSHTNIFPQISIYLPPVSVCRMKALKTFQNNTQIYVHKIFIILLGFIYDLYNCILRTYKYPGNIYYVRYGWMMRLYFVVGSIE